MLELVVPGCYLANCLVHPTIGYQGIVPTPYYSIAPNALTTTLLHSKRLKYAYEILKINLSYSFKINI